MKKFASGNCFSVKHKTPQMNTFRRNLRFKKVLYLVVIFGAAGVLVTSSFPVLGYGEYESTGPMESSFKLPSDFQELRSFFENNFTSPDYYTLILPLSRVNAVYMKIGNGTFPDPSNLFQSYIPYPVIDWAQTNTSICIDNKLTELPTNSIIPMLVSQHIKYVIINPYVNMSSWWMNSAPNNEPIKLNTIIESLLNSSANYQKIGAFIVFTLQDVKPIALVYSEPDIIEIKSLNQYFSFLSNLSIQSNTPYNTLIDAVPEIGSSNSFISIHSINPGKYNYIKSNVDGHYYALNYDGKLYALPTLSQSSSLSLNPTRLFTANSTTMSDEFTNFGSNLTVYTHIMGGFIDNEISIT